MTKLYKKHIKQLLKDEVSFVAKLTQKEKDYLLKITKILTYTKVPTVGNYVSIKYDSDCDCRTINFSSTPFVPEFGQVVYTPPRTPVPKVTIDELVTMDNVRFKVTPKLSKKIQKAMFKAGKCWMYGKTIIQRLDSLFLGIRDEVICSNPRSDLQKVKVVSELEKAVTEALEGDEHFKLEVTPKESTLVQKLVFAAGGCWGIGGGVQEIKYTGKPYLYIYKNLNKAWIIRWGRLHYGYHNHFAKELLPKRDTSKLVQVDTYPTDGTQFVAIWVYKGKIWSDTCKMVDGKVRKANSLGYFDGVLNIKAFSRSTQISYFVYKD